MIVTKDVKTIKAYSDCNDLSEDERDLHYLSSKKLSLDEWEEVMIQSLNECGGYNRFDPEKVAASLRDFEEMRECHFQPAREYSVCLYIQGPLRILNSFLANKEYWEYKGCLPDELSLEKTPRNVNESDSEYAYQLRFWWD